MQQIVDGKAGNGKELEENMESANQYDNEITVVFSAISENESFARMVAAAFVTRLDPTLEELADLKTAVSEAVTNAVIHGYAGRTGEVRMRLGLKGHTVFVAISDAGVGIADIHKAMEPMYTTAPQEERSGMGFSFMEAFMDAVTVESAPGKGTTVHMRKAIGE